MDGDGPLPQTINKMSLSQQMALAADPILVAKWKVVAGYFEINPQTIIFNACYGNPSAEECAYDLVLRRLVGLATPMSELEKCFRENGMVALIQPKYGFKRHPPPSPSVTAPTRGEQVVPAPKVEDKEPMVIDNSTVAPLAQEEEPMPVYGPALPSGSMEAEEPMPVYGPALPPASERPISIPDDEKIMGKIACLEGEIYMLYSDLFEPKEVFRQAKLLAPYVLAIQFQMPDSDIYMFRTKGAIQMMFKFPKEERSFSAVLDMTLLSAETAKEVKAKMEKCDHFWKCELVLEGRRKMTKKLENSIVELIIEFLQTRPITSDDYVLMEIMS